MSFRVLLGTFSSSVTVTLTVTLFLFLVSSVTEAGVRVVNCGEDDPLPTQATLDSWVINDILFTFYSPNPPTHTYSGEQYVSPSNCYPSYFMAVAVDRGPEGEIDKPFFTYPTLFLEQWTWMVGLETILKASRFRVAIFSAATGGSAGESLLYFSTAPDFKHLKTENAEFLERSGDAMVIARRASAATARDRCGIVATFSYDNSNWPWEHVRVSLNARGELVEEEIDFSGC